ncbi:MAG: DoxX family membrane protein [Verrucomicrobiota bacterium]|nr:DoxX family membrane protein [Verrucomicrobiota bacterium]
MQSPFMGRAGGPAKAASRSLVWTLLALVVAAVFVYAGAAKITDPSKFAHDIQNFKIVPWSIAIRAAFYLPWLEIICGIALLFEPLRRGALAILTGLVAVFIVATISAQARGINLDCGCFGSASKGMTFGMHMLIDGAILAALIALWILPTRR